MSRKKLPELSNPPEVFYNKKESNKYHKNSRINKIQREISERCLELLDIKYKCHTILDIGCGSGISSECIKNKYFTIGMDISREMLELNYTNDIKLCVDIGNKWPLKDDSVDYAISCSVIQWLFQSYKKEDIPTKRIKLFFRELNRVVKHGCSLQFYATNKQTEIFLREARIAGFKGGMQVDFPETKKEKKYLILHK